jgi:pimeloyl-ACP methyl ester carboxylesterase
MLRRVGCGVQVVGQLLVTAGDNPARLSSEAAWAMLCGSAPLPASSGQTRRHRLNRGGDRAANIGPATKRMLPPDRDDAWSPSSTRTTRVPSGGRCGSPSTTWTVMGRSRLCPSGVRAWVVFGDKDDVGLFDDERRGLEGCRRVTSVSIPDTGHFTLKTHPGEVAELILEAVCAAAQTPTQESSSRSSTEG